MSVLLITEEPRHQDLQKSLDKADINRSVSVRDGKQNSDRPVSFHELYDCFKDAHSGDDSIQHILYVPAKTLPGTSWVQHLKADVVVTGAMAQWSKLDDGFFHETLLNDSVEISSSSVIRPGCILLPATLFSEENTKHVHQSANQHVYELWLQLTAFIKKCGFETIFESDMNAVKPLPNPYKVCGRIGFAFPILAHHKLYSDQSPSKLDEGFLKAYHEELYQEFKQAQEANRRCELEVEQAKQKGQHNKLDELKSPLRQLNALTQNEPSREKISVCITSFPARFESLQKVLEQITPHVDAIYLHLNNADSIPDFISDNQKITATFGEDFNATGKTRHLGEIDQGYIFILDDDNNIPEDYFQKSVSALKKYDNKAAITYHGSILRPDSSWYYDKYTLYGYTKPLEEDALVTLPGSGFLAYHSSLISLTFKDFMPYTMVDLLFAIRFHESNIPIICVQRKNNWLTVQDPEESGLWHLFKGKITIHSLVASVSDKWSFDEYRSLYERFICGFPQMKPASEKGVLAKISLEGAPQDWTNSKGNVSATTSRARLEYQSTMLIQFDLLIKREGQIALSNDEVALQNQLKTKNSELNDLHNSLETRIGQELAHFGERKSLGTLFSATGGIVRQILSNVLTRASDK